MHIKLVLTIGNTSRPKNSFGHHCLKMGGEGGAQWANLGLHEDILNQYCYFMYFQPNFHVRTLYKHCVCVFLVFLCLRLRIFVKCALKTEFSQD